MSGRLQIIVDLGSPDPAFRQVADQLRHLLVTGLLKPAGRLPSVRRLATDLGIHHNTVAEAYRTLAAEGWLEVSQGKAVCVLERGAGRPNQSKQRKLRESFGRRLQNLIAEMRSQGIPEEWIEAEFRAIQGPHKGES